MLARIQEGSTSPSVFPQGVLISGDSFLARRDLLFPSDKPDAAMTELDEMLDGSFRSIDVIHSDIIRLHSSKAASEKNDRNAAVLNLHR